MLLISNKEFKMLGDFIQSGYGIKMPTTKKTMVQARLQKRLRQLGFDSFKVYCDFVFSSDSGSNEIIHLIDAITTNKTDFFREPHHFRYLKDVALPTFMQSLNGVSRKLMVWSAGCSTGEEPYTIAMVLDDAMKEYDNVDYSIIATDISSQVLQSARTAVYSFERIEPVPYEMKKQYLLKSKDKTQQKVRIVPKLRNNVVFRSLNFMDDNYNIIREKMDCIFCRNVIIYFERKVQAEIILKLTKHLRTGGYLFLGHSETIFGLDLPLKQVSSTVYQKIK